MMRETATLRNLEKRNNFLKSILLHEQLKYGNCTFTYFKKCSQLIVNEYKQHKSLFKSALSLGMDYGDVMNWYVQGLLGNSPFDEFYDSIKRINQNQVSNEDPVEEMEISEETLIDGQYQISQYGDGWSYKTFIDGEKVFIISGDLKKLKEKVKSKGLPLD